MIKNPLKKKDFSVCAYYIQFDTSITYLLINNK